MVEDAPHDQMDDELMDDAYQALAEAEAFIRDVYDWPADTELVYGVHPGSQEDARAAAVDRSPVEELLAEGFTAFTVQDITPVLGETGEEYAAAIAYHRPKSERVRREIEERATFLTVPQTGPVNPREVDPVRD
jgi:hypothetical protein